MSTPWDAAQMKRRTFLHAVGLAGAGAALSSCGFAGDGGGSAGSSDLLMMGWGSDIEKKGVQAVVDSFNKGRDSTVRYQFVPNDGYDTKMNTLVAADDLPDLSYQAEGTAMRLGAQGKVANVLDYVDQYEQLGDLLPTVVHQWEEGEGLTQLAVEMMMLWYNVDAINDAGVPKPPAVAADAWSWDEFVQHADKLTVDANGRHPSESGFDSSAVEQWGTLAPTGWSGFFPLLKSNGADIIDEDGTGYALDSPEAVEVITRIHDLIYVHRVAPTPAQYETIASTFTAGLLENRRVAMVLDGQWNLLDLGQMDFAYSLGVLPKFGEPKTINLCNAIVASAKSDDLETAMELLIHLGDPAQNDLYAKGLWMPLQSTYYTDPEAVASWTDNPVHPPEYKTAALDYLVENGEPEPAYRVKNWDRISNLFGADLDALFASGEGGTEKVRSVLEGIRPKVEPHLEGVYPDTLDS